MFFPIRTDSPLRTTPYMNWALIAANVVMFIIQSRLWPNPGQRVPIALDPRDPHVLHFFTYMFLHGSITHILGNMLFLYIFGNNVNDKMGHLGYLGFYLAGGVASGIVYVLWQGSHAVPVIGASGAIAAVTGAFLILFPRSHITVLYFFLLIGTFELSCVWFILGFFAYDLVYLAMADHVAHIAHVGGTVFGMATCYGMLAGNLLPRDQFDVVALVKQWNRRRQYRDAVSGGWNPYLAPAPPDAVAAGGWVGARPPPPPDPRTGRVMDLRASISEAIAHSDLTRAAQLFLELKSVDPQQVLSRQAQLDVANQLTNQQLYPQAADAYEGFLRHYPKFEQIEQIELMLGLIYARYLANYARAKECLLRAMARLHSERELTMARSELDRIEPLLAGRGAQSPRA
jgi:membrane associated rhomboid family serine protease